MDHLVLGNLLLAKNRQPAGLLADLDAYRQLHPLD
jgi:hypothetical protein